MSDMRVLFVCQHGAAKSVLAAMHFQRQAERRGLRTEATCAGTEPDSEIAPRVVTELLAEGIDVRGRHPRPLTREDVASATRIVTFGCDIASLAPRGPVDRWDDVPAVSEGYEAAREAIDARVARLVGELTGSP